MCSKSKEKHKEENMKYINKIYPAILITGFICLAMMPGAYAYAADRNSCSDDIAKFCSNADPKKGGAVKCINAHANFISDTCRETMKMINVEE
jgi:hypothetical protein